MAKPKRLLSVVVSVILLVIAAIAIQTSGHAQLVSSPRIQPLDASEWTDVEREVLGTRARGNDTIHVFSTIVRNPDLARQWESFAGYIEGSTSTLPRRDREMLILRTAWLSRDGYVWSGHSVGFKRAAGGTDEELSRIIEGPKAKGWNKFEAALLQAADELHKDQFISDATWKILAEKYNDKQLLDAIFTVGEYTMVAMYINSAGVQLEKSYTGFPKQSH
jgi:alkylhydroperoxidase family enzyme